MLDEAGRLRERARSTWGWNSLPSWKTRWNGREGFPGQSALMDSWDGFIRILEKRRSVTMGLLAVGIPDLKLCASVTIETRQAPDFQGQTALLAEQLRDYARRGYAVAMLSGGQARGERLWKRCAKTNFRLLPGGSAPACTGRNGGHAVGADARV